MSRSQFEAWLEVEIYHQWKGNYNQYSEYNEDKSSNFLKGKFVLCTVSVSVPETFDKLDYSLIMGRLRVLEN